MSKKKSNPMLPTPTKSQQEALALFGAWYEKNQYKKQPILRIGGPAGTGKSHLINYIKYLFDLDETNCWVVAYTGQAVNVLRRKGIHAKTIHSSFMYAKEVPLKDKTGNMILKNGIPVVTTKFVPIKKISSKVKLIICDEYSFVPEELENLMKSHHVPVLALGDPFQLPPVTGKPCFSMEDLDYILTDIVRQDKDSEIVDLATRIREFEPINPFRYTNQVFFANPMGTIEDTFLTYRACFRRSDMNIVSTNKQRQIITDLYREHIVKTKSPYPVTGERMICRRNDWNLNIGGYPLTNGMVGTCMTNIPRSNIERKNGTYYMDFQPSFIENDYFGNLMCNFKFLHSQFGDKEVTKYDMGHMLEFGHALTVHLVQGAEAPGVTFMDSYRRDQEYMARLRYTAVSRAKDWLVYIQPWPDYREEEAYDDID